MKAFEYVNVSSVDAAIEAFRSSVKRDPRFAEARANLARVYLSLGRRAEAETEVRAAVSIWERYLEEGRPASVERRRIREKIDRLLEDLSSGAGNH